jgi:hypothetical protein
MSNIHWACTVCGDGSNSKATASSVALDSTAHQRATGHFSIFDDGRESRDSRNRGANE